MQDAVEDNNLRRQLFNLFSGGALRQMSVAMLGVYPYITASIIMTLVTPLFPALQALREEGESGRNRIELYQHWMTVPLCFIQGYAQLVILVAPSKACSDRWRRPGHVRPVAHGP